jgi:hypothetical protein
MPRAISSPRQERGCCGQSARNGKATAGFVRWLMDTTDDAGRRVAVISGMICSLAFHAWPTGARDTIFCQRKLVAAGRGPLGQRGHRASGTLQRADCGSEPGSFARWDLRERQESYPRESPETPAVMVFAKIDSPDSQWTVPSSLGLPSVPVPRYLAFSPAVVELGRELFFDPKLSSTGAVSMRDVSYPGSLLRR